MSEDLKPLLDATIPDDLPDISSPEYLYHPAVEAGVIEDILRKFPNSEESINIIKNQAIKFEALSDGWQDRVVAEVNQLIGLLPEGEIPRINSYSEGKADYGTDEMFFLRAEMWYVVSENAAAEMDEKEIFFLNNFFYGIDFTHWSKWAAILSFTTLDLRLPNILNTRRNNVDFAIHGDQLVFTNKSKSVGLA